MKYANRILIVLFLLCIARLWIIHLHTSFWLDEMVTAFVVHHGAADPSLDIAPQVAKSNYYQLARAADAIAGTSEIGYRIPSVLVMLLALWCVGRLAARLIHPDAAWFAVFACLALKAFNTEAIDARPYALGMFILTASVLCLIDWLDSARWIFAAGFFLCGVLLWRVHLLFWPLYLVFVIYALARLSSRKTNVRWLPAIGVFAALALSLLPVAIDLLPILHNAHTHVFVPAPHWSELADALKWKLLIPCVAIGALLTRARRPGPPQHKSASSMDLILALWLIHPIALFIFSKASGNSVFIPRYLSVALPGAALAATLAASFFIRTTLCWRLGAIILGLGVFFFVGNWQHPWTPHTNSDWRSAAAAVRTIATSDTPVICPSAFIEAQSPVWRPDYPLPGFLYSQLDVYPTGGQQVLLPFTPSRDAEAYAHILSSDLLPRSPRFAIYGNDRNVNFWRDWFLKQPELAQWRARSLGNFGDVEAVVLEH